jgi:hypothetical protein|uniref:DNA mismatch repair proteins mutS family domain-containing protein n=1 Tax=viral metagenome TaxID=1070528 RepID=A0A6C0IN88_9ZZZZ
MNLFMQNINTQVKTQIEKLFFNKEEKNKYNTDVYSNFQLPISYLEQDTHMLSESISKDLELTPSTINVDNNDAQSIYEFFLSPSNQFGENVMEKWKTHYTSNKQFIEETKDIITNFSSMGNFTMPVSCDRVLAIWKNIKQDEYFLQKYHYMDWEMIKHLNHSRPFLQSTSTVHLFSPAVSLMLPILFFIFPFIILKVKNVPITVSQYISLLKTIAKNHFFGVAINAIENFSLTNFIYLIVSLGFFVFQIYQNITTCKNYYHNIKNINNEMIDLRNYLKYSIQNMQNLLKLTGTKDKYIQFNNVTLLHLENLLRMKDDLALITPFQNNFKKFTCMGQLLQSYYVLYENEAYAEALKYSIGFEGYLNNLQGIYSNYIDKSIGMCKLGKTNKFTKQYYPVIDSQELVENNCDLDKNIIISAPNKSGKTTFLKTTLINIILTQQTGFGFYTKGELQPYTHLHCYLNIPDTSARDSLFQAESRRCKAILDKIQNENPNEKHFCIFDELYSGTNPDEATKAGIAFLQYLQKFSRVDFILTTHYINVCKHFSKSKHTRNFKMDVSINQDGTFHYRYKIKKGISKIKGATRVLKDMNYPDEIIRSIENK